MNHRFVPKFFMYEIRSTKGHKFAIKWPILTMKRYLKPIEDIFILKRCDKAGPILKPLIVSFQVAGQRKLFSSCNLK